MSPQDNVVCWVNRVVSVVQWLAHMLASRSRVRIPVWAKLFYRYGSGW